MFPPSHTIARILRQRWPLENKKGQFGPFLLQGCRLKAGTVLSVRPSSRWSSSRYSHLNCWLYSCIFHKRKRGAFYQPWRVLAKKGTPSILQPSAWLEIVTDTNANASNKSSLATKNSGLVANSDYISLW